MKNVSLHILLLFVQLYFASELEGSHLGHLIKTASGKVFLTRSRKKANSPKKDTEDGGHDHSNIDEIEVT